MGPLRVHRFVSALVPVEEHARSSFIGATVAGWRSLRNSERWRPTRPECSVGASWRQPAWIGVLRCAPAVLDGLSALRAAGMMVDIGESEVHVAVEASRTVQRPGVLVRRIRNLGASALWHTSPPRLRVEPALLHVAAHAADDFRAVGLLTDAVADRGTTPNRLRRDEVGCGVVVTVWPEVHSQEVLPPFGGGPGGGGARRFVS